MATSKQTISVRLDPVSKRRVEKAARLMKQSSGAFLERIAEQRAREVLMAWALARYRAGEASLSELASETGLDVEEFVDALSAEGRAQAIETFLQACRAVADTRGDAQFLETAERAVKLLRREK